MASPRSRPGTPSASSRSRSPRWRSPHPGRAAGPLADQLGLSVQALAGGVLQVAISGMLVPIEQLLARAGMHGSELTLMPFGGRGPMLGPLLGQAAWSTQGLVP